MKRFEKIFVWKVSTLLCFIQCSECARILASVSTPSYSHQIAFMPIWKELAKRGHEIVLLTTDPMDDMENIRQIDLSFSYDILNSYNYDTLIAGKTLTEHLLMVNQFGNLISDVLFGQLNNVEVQALMQNKSERFDLLMIETVFPVHAGLVQIFKSPLIGLASLDLSHELHGLLGNDVHSVLYPEPFIVPVSYPLTFSQRAMSSLAVYSLHLYNHFILMPQIQEGMKRIFGDNSKSIQEIMKIDLDMLFVNSNPIFHHIRALSPNTITFGGSTRRYIPKQLPEDLRRFLDNATNGVIYFSLGSNIKSRTLSNELKQLFLESFEDLPFKVIWKFEADNLSIKNDNVMVKKWLPQRDILRHPNVKVFITQCGLQSIEEAIMSHIPMVALPFFADQPANGQTLQNNGLGVLLDYKSLEKELFKKTILEVITNPEYKEKVIEAANLLTDVEISGLEKVIWWTEYVLRNGGAKHLKNPAIRVPFYQYYLLDVITLVGSITSLILYAFIKISLVIITKWRSNKLKKKLL